MYRLSEYSSPLLQKLVTNEIIRGFQVIFGLNDEENLIRPDRAELFFGCSDVLRNLLESGLATEEALAAKLSIMYMAMKDEQFEYTFDEFGEFLLYEMIDDIDSDIQDGMRFWEPGGTWFDRKALRQEVMEAVSDWDEYEPTEEEIQATLDAMTMFPRLADELKGETLLNFAFWDTDFYRFYAEEDFDAVVNWFRSHPEMGYSNGKMTKLPLDEE